MRVCVCVCDYVVKKIVFAVVNGTFPDGYTRIVFVKFLRNDTSIPRREHKDKGKFYCPKLKS